MIYNKQILESLKDASNNLKDILSHKDELIKSATKDLSKEEIKIFNDQKKKLDVFISNNDFNGAFKFITKTKMQNKKTNPTK